MQVQGGGQVVLGELWELVAVSSEEQIGAEFLREIVKPIGVGINAMLVPGCQGGKPARLVLKIRRDVCLLTDVVQLSRSPHAVADAQLGRIGERVTRFVLEEQRADASRLSYPQAIIHVSQVEQAGGELGMFPEGESVSSSGRELPARGQEEILKG